MQEDPFLIIALGHEYRRDDGFGAYVVRQLEKESAGIGELWLHEGDVSDLLDRWKDRRVIVIDACESQGAPGRLHVLSPLLVPCLLAEAPVSSHGLGLAKTIELGEVLGKLPRELTVLTVEGRDFSSGWGLSAETEASVEKTLKQLKKLIAAEEMQNA